MNLGRITSRKYVCLLSVHANNAIWCLCGGGGGYKQQPKPCALSVLWNGGGGRYYDDEGESKMCSQFNPLWLHTVVSCLSFPARLISDITNDLQPEQRWLPAERNLNKRFDLRKTWIWNSAFFLKCQKQLAVVLKSQTSPQAMEEYWFYEASDWRFCPILAYVRYRYRLGYANVLMQLAQSKHK